MEPRDPGRCTSVMTRRTPVTIIASLLLAFAAGCGSSAHTSTEAINVVGPPAPVGPLQLAVFDDGVGAVATGRTAPVWREAGAVAALDGSIVFSIRDDSGNSNPRLVRLDRRTGRENAAAPVPTGFTIAAVAPGGKWIALTDRRAGYGNQGRAHTTLAIFDTTAGEVSHLLNLPGDVQPEAFSTDGSLVFALHYFPDHYRVQTIAVDGTMLSDTFARDKTPAEDMHGNPIHGVLNADHTLLATLYRDPTSDDEPAFVHVLDLEHGWSYCADLPAPFGTGPPGDDTIRLAPDDVVEVAATRANRIAAIHIDAVHEPMTEVPVTYRDGAIASPPAEFSALTGFEYVIAPVDPEKAVSGS
jgi:hypothetical protein